MRGILIQNRGLLTTVQDLGRKGFRRYGMPVSGAMDKFSMQCANWLVGNRRTDPVLEATLAGPSVEFLSAVNFSITGAEAVATLDGRPVEGWKCIRARKGSLLEIAPFIAGARIYIAFGGGINCDLIMGSASTYLPGKTGGHHGREIRKGDILTFKNKGSLVIKKRSVPIQERPVFARSVQLRVLPGVNFDLFSESDRDILLGEEYAISTNSDRMGFRLEGRALEEAPFKKELLSYGIQMGAIQVPGDGKPIIMGADAQTTGGYRQFANVITADLDHLAQMKPSDRVNFKITDPDFAIEMLQKKQGYIDQLFRKTV